MKILSVDDITVVRKITRKVVEALGGEFFEATNGFEALTILEDNDGKIDLVLLDWNMPLMDGFIFLNKVRNNHKFAHIPVIMVTAENEKDKIIRAVQSGATNYIAKPFTEQSLARKIIDCLGKEFEYEILTKSFVDALSIVTNNKSGQHIKEITGKNTKPEGPVREVGYYTGTIFAIGKFCATVIISLDKVAASALANSMTGMQSAELSELNLVDVVLRIVEQVAAKVKEKSLYIDDQILFPLITAGLTGADKHILHNTVYSSDKSYTVGENILRLQVHCY